MDSAARNEALLAELKPAFGDGGRHAEFQAAAESGMEMPSLTIAPEQLYPLLEILKNDPAFSFEQLSYITATDEWTEEAEITDNRFRIVYFLLSLTHGWRLKIQTRVSRSEAPVIRSIVPLYLGANWMEREVFDMFGIRFEGHPEMKRILMSEDYGHYPLRKDFPLEGIAPDRLYREWERARDAEAAGGAKQN